jgi:riboflavin synthase
MFTGIIEEIGNIDGVIRTKNGLKLEIRASKVLEDIAIGNSIAVNGICLTVVEHNNNCFSVDVMFETVEKTNISELKIGSFVNLERAVKVSGRFDGHFVLGHIDGTGRISRKHNEYLEISIQEELPKYIVKKGSIAVDGISLTVVDVKENFFSVAIIPHTLDKTTLGLKRINDKVNIEVDIVAKHIEKLLLKMGNKSNITMDFLKGHGY